MNTIEHPPQDLDITAYVCPMTFVRAKLAAERLGPGQSLVVRLNAGEALVNVPRSLSEQGFTVAMLGPCTADATVHRIRVTRGGGR